MKSLSIVVPIYLDGSLARHFCEELNALIQGSFFQKHNAELLELIFISDGRPEDVPFLQECKEQFPWVRYVVFSRNFGQHIALSCGMEFSRGDLVAFTDVDCEDPLTALGPLMEELTTKGAEVSVGVRVDRQVSWRRKISSQVFHFLLSRLTGLDLPHNATTMRVMSRKYVDAFKTMKERSRYIPGMEAWLGFKTVYLPIEQNPSKKMQSSYTFRNKVRLATTALLSFSDLPLRWAVTAGFGVTLISFVAGLAIFFAKIFIGGFQAGFATYTILVSFFGGFQIFVTGVAGLYIGRILTEVQARPLYVIKEKSWNEGLI